MMKCKRLALLLLSVTLVACQNGQPKAETEKSEEIAQETASSTQQETGENLVSNNGSYHSISGDYGEIIIVNKKYPLSADYNPGENAEAKAALLSLIEQMQVLGYDVSNNYSGFRSYETQTGLYQSYVASDGQENADRYSARPGYSEHQTGLAFDLTESSGALLTEETAANWLKENAHEYGFVVRYPEGKESITGYMAESWHIRFIGDEAKAIYTSGLTLEEYYGVSGGDYQ